MKRQRAKTVAVAAMMGSLVLGVTACSTQPANSGGNGSGGNNTQNTSGGSGGPSGNPIVMGVLAPFTGPQAVLGQDMMYGVKLAVAEVNAAGGVLGRPLKVVTEDTVADPTDAVPAMNKLLYVDKASVVLGPTSITAGAVISITQKAQIPEVVIGGSTQFDTTSDPYFFRTSPSDSQQGVAMAYYAMQKNWKTAALVFEQQPAAQTLKAPIQKTYEKHGGKIVATVDIVPGQSSYRSEIQKIFAKHPQVVFTQVSAQTASVLFPEVQQMGYLTVPWLGTNTVDSSDFFKAVGPSIASSYIYSTQSSSAGGMASKHFLSQYKKMYKTDQIANLSNNVYDGIIDLALAMDKAGTTNGPAVDKAMTEVSNPPGTKISDYASGLKAIKQGTVINWQGASGSDNFNKYHNVFGPFQVLKFNKDGSTTQVTTLSAAALAAY